MQKIHPPFLLAFLPIEYISPPPPVLSNIRSTIIVGDEINIGDGKTADAITTSVIERKGPEHTTPLPCHPPPPLPVIAARFSPPTLFSPPIFFYTHDLFLSPLPSLVTMSFNFVVDGP
jgi:hypothetical protein